MKIVKVVLAVLLASSAGAQSGQNEPQHAPTAETCQRDLTFWYSLETATEYRKAQTLLITDEVPNKTAIAKLPITELLARMTEMINCRAADKSNHAYFDAHDFYHEVFVDRVLRFVYRHNLMPQLKREDAQGTR